MIDMLSRRTLLSCALYSITALPIWAQEVPRQRRASRTLPWPHDLHLLAQQAQRFGQPLLLLAGLPGCPWCELLRRNYLLPMRNEGVHAFEFLIDDTQGQMLDFAALRVTPKALSARLHITMSPTLLFFDAQGQEVAPRIEGVASAQMIGAILEERLAQARLRIAPRSP